MDELDDGIGIGIGIGIGGGSFRRRRLSSIQAQNGWAGLTLGAVLDNDKTPTPLNRTLFEIFRDDDHPTNNSAKNNWKSFKDRLRLRRAADLWTQSSTSRSHRTSISNSPVTAPVDLPTQLLRRNSSRRTSPYESDISLSNSPVAETAPIRSQMLRRDSSRRTSSPPANRASVSLSDALAAEREQIERVVSQSEEQQQQQPVARMSLMDLLEETDRQMGWVTYVAAEEEEEEEAAVGEHTCSVCMVRHKGAAFIPCGHTFCRLCSRELWVSRGNCPLCNGFILEILDIF